MTKGSNLENAYALIIGVSKYQDVRIPELNFTRADSEGILKILTDSNKMGLKQDRIKVLLDDDATRTNIRKAISGWLFKNADKESTVFVYFAGHGGVEEDRFDIEKDKLAKYLLPFDSDFDNLFASALSNREFNELLSIIKSKKLVIFMDSCYSGGVSERKARDMKITEDPYQKFGEGEGRLVIAASQPDQRSFEDTSVGHGIFTHHLIEALSGAADFDKDGYVTIMELYKYLSENVPKTAKRLAGGVQEPIFRGDIKNDFPLAVNHERLEEIYQENENKKSLKRLSDLYYGGELSPEQYELTHRLIKSNLEVLSNDDKKKLKLLNDLLSDGISISTFKDEVGCSIVEGAPHIVEPEGGNEKGIIELSSDAHKLFEKGMYTDAIAKWQEVLKLDQENRKANDGIKISKRSLDEIEEKKKTIDEFSIIAQSMYDDGKYLEAIDKWNEILKLDYENKAVKEWIEKAKDEATKINKTIEVCDFCQNCRHQNKDKLNYCTQCGANLSIT